MEEKQALEQVETRQTESPPDKDNDLTHLNTFESVDIENRHAYKGDDSDGKVDYNMRKLAASAFLAMLYTGSQVLLYFCGGSLQFIVKDIGGSVATGWLPTANTLAIASVAPFVGYLQDLFGKRYISLFGAALLCIGCVVLGTAHSFGHAIVGMAIAGAGAGIGELTGLAGLAETVPVRYRGYSLAVLTAFVLPFCPYVMYSELLSTHHTWRWGPWISLIYNAITCVGLAVTYFPHAHTRVEGVKFTTVLKKIDYVGGFLSITGLTLFLVALQSGGYTHEWKSAYVLCTLLVGFFTLVAWVTWEWKFARHPMCPPELFRGQKVVSLAFVVAFIAGMNFFSVLNFWPLLISTVYDPDPIKVGFRGMAPGFSTAIGAIFFNAMLSFWKGGSKWVLFIASFLVTSFGGALSIVSPDNEVATIAIGTITGFAIGGLIVPSATTAMIAAPDALITTCAALSLSIRAVGGSIGYSIYFNVFENKLKAALPEKVAEFAIGAGLPLESAKVFVVTFLTAPTEIMSVSGVTPAVLEAATVGARWAYSYALRYVWYTSIAFGCCAMVASVMIPNTRRFETNRVAVAL